MNTPRGGHSAFLLASGKVLVLFGGSGITSTELYDPATGNWTVNGNTGATAQFAFSVTLLRSGKVLITGGANCFYPRPCTEVSSAELCDPSVGASTFTGSMKLARSSHSATLLSNGQVLAAGGETPRAQDCHRPSSGRLECHVPMARQEKRRYEVPVEKPLIRDECAR
jgi:hypothetical protein